MLPQNYLVKKNRRRHLEGDDEDDEDEPPRTHGGAAQPQTSAPPLSVTGVLCDTHALSIPGRGSLQYTIFRPRYVHMKPPLICLAGGPYLPWTYLSTLVHLVNDRSLVFFDPIGCGQSKRIRSSKDDAPSTTTTTPTLEENLSSDNSNSPIPAMVYDFVQLLQHLQLKHYHLYGHSFGGIIAYEALRSDDRPGTCLSLILSSTPAHLPHALTEIQNLKTALAVEATTAQKPPQPLPGEEDIDDEDNPDAAVSRLFAVRHECRVRPLPLQLQQSFAMAGFSSSPAGWESVRDYVAEPPTRAAEDGRPTKLKMPLLLLRGEFDFISQDCMDAWWDCFETTTVPESTTTTAATSVDDGDIAPNHSARPVATLKGVAHYAMLEDEEGYGTTVRGFLARVPEPALQIPTPKMPSVPKSRSRLPR